MRIIIEIYQEDRWFAVHLLGGDGLPEELHEETAGWSGGGALSNHEMWLEGVSGALFEGHLDELSGGQMGFGEVQGEPAEPHAR